ncbi:MAG: hypothetical protein ABR599_10300 [Gemmatimonadota bacterium]
MKSRGFRFAAPLAVAGLAAVLGLRAAPATRAQGTSAPPQEGDASARLDPSAGQALARLSYQREFFYYEGTGRRDPFQPLLDVDLRAEGPRFDELVLTGLFAGAGGQGMVVVEDADRKGYFLELGDVLGKATLVQILRDEAVFDVRDFGISRRETLKLQRPEEVS